MHAEEAAGGKREGPEVVHGDGAAGRELGMSYRRAWLLVDEMNRCWAERLVEAQAGGGEGRGARVTSRGLEILQAYRRLESALSSAAVGPDLDALKGLLRPAPAAN